MAVWAAYRFHHPTCGATPPSGSVRILRRSLKDFSGEQLVAVIHWFHDSDDSTCSFMRGKKLTGLDNIMRIEALPKRVEAASKPWHRAQAAGGTVIDTEGNVEPIKPQKPAGKRSDSFESAVSTYDLAQRLRAEEEAHHGFGS
jgi:hypothetical protein